MYDAAGHFASKIYFMMKLNHRWVDSFGYNMLALDVYELTSQFSNYSYSRGAWIDTVEGKNQTSYPTNGISGSYWYIYKGLQ